MIKTEFEDAFSTEWIESNITDRTNELVILRQIIPWDKIIKKLATFYDKLKGPIGKSIRVVVAIFILNRYRLLSDRKIMAQIKENRYIQYFCNVPDEKVHYIMHPSNLSKLRNRYGIEGIEIIEQCTFDLLHSAGVIKGDNMLTDSSVLENNILYPTDVTLLYKAFKKLEIFANHRGLPVWWDNSTLKKIWREFNLNRDKDKDKIPDFFFEILMMFADALDIFKKIVNSVNASEREKALLELLIMFQDQNGQKLEGKKHIENRIVSFDEPDARPIVKGKKHPKCEFGTTAQYTFNREGFIITTENFIGKPSDKTLYPKTLELFIKRTKRHPDTIVGDKGYRSRTNLKNVPKNTNHVFLGLSTDVCEEKREFCQKARSATEGFISVAKNLRGLDCSLYKGLKGDRIWTLLCQTACNLKKFILLNQKDKIDEDCLVKLGLLG